MIEITSRDIVAAEAHCHKSCYRNYNRNKEDTNENEKEEVTIGVGKEFKMYQRSKKKLTKNFSKTSAKGLCQSPP